jgi:hypothetical protein
MPLHPFSFDTGCGMRDYPQTLPWDELAGNFTNAIGAIFDPDKRIFKVYHEFF